MYFKAHKKVLLKVFYRFYFNSKSSKIILFAINFAIDRLRDLLHKHVIRMDLFTCVFFTVKPRGYALGKGHHESSVHRNPYDAHDAYDAIRTQDADLAVSF